MAHDVFISYSAHDKPAADAVCAKLESRGIRCWTAPRDIRPGMSWGGAIVEAIDGARVMLLLFSSHTNNSPQIKREVERAVQKEIVIVPVRVEDVRPTGDFAYFLSTPRWLDAITPPFERHLDRIADSAKFWLERIEGDGATSEAPRPTPPAREEPSAAAAPTVVAPARTRRKWIVPSIVALVIALVGTAAFFAAPYYFAQLVAAARMHTQPTGRELPTAETFREPKMIVVPAGTFTMGSQGGDDAESPQHRVAIGYSFAVGKYPVTRDEYARFASETSANSEWQNPGFAQTGRDPVVNVSWDDAKAYVAWLSNRTGHKYRLLSESEYEYAEQAGTSTTCWWGDGDADLCRYANGGPCIHHGTVPVGSYPANGFGLYDMAGNVWEWTEDCWNENYTGAPEDGTAWTAGTCGQRALRGGSWGFFASFLRSASRYGAIPGVRDYLNGFRVARTL